MKIEAKNAAQKAFAIEAEEVCEFIRHVIRPEGCSLSTIYPIKEESL